MLVFGDYVFIPFAFSIQCHYLLNYPDFTNPILPLLIIAIFFTGFSIFRIANSQKNQFKTNPTKPIWGKKPETIDGKLLVSGFWGYGRHMNYTGDLIMSIAYCLPCGLQLGGYFYAFYLFALLLHRANRDDTKCRAKYGEKWRDYCKRVPHVYIPFKPIDSMLTAIGKILYTITNKKDL
jgi:delta14-sterol reductase